MIAIVCSLDSSIPITSLADGKPESGVEENPA